MPMHDDELQITAAQVSALVADQAPGLAGAHVTELRTPGTANAIFRVGDGATARFPLRTPGAVNGPGAAAAARESLARDAARAREFGAHSPFPAPDPLLVGEPGHGYPTAWSLQTWVPGEPASPTSHAGSTGLADDLARLVGALRAADVEGRAFDGSGRGGRLGDHEDWVQECLTRSEGLLDTAAIRGVWERCRELPPPARLALCHTDLIPSNLLVEGDRLVGVLDTGECRAADPALDLVAGWHLLDSVARERFRQALAVEGEEWERGMAWALEQAIGLVWYYERSNPPMAELGRSTLRRILDAPA